MSHEIILDPNDPLDQKIIKAQAEARQLQREICARDPDFRALEARLNTLLEVRREHLTPKIKKVTFDEILDSEETDTGFDQFKCPGCMSTLLEKDNIFKHIILKHRFSKLDIAGQDPYVRELLRNNISLVEFQDFLEEWQNQEAKNEQERKGTDNGPDTP